MRRLNRVTGIFATSVSDRDMDKGSEASHIAAPILVESPAFDEAVGRHPAGLVVSGADGGELPGGPRLWCGGSPGVCGRLSAMSESWS